MKKIFTLIAVAAMALTVNAQESVIVSFAEGTESANKIDLTEGFSMQCTGNETKNLSSAKKLTIDDTEYISIKISNGAENTVWLPAGKKAASVTFYSYVNKSTSDAADRDNFWSNVNGTDYDVETGGKMKTFTDVDDYQKNPDVSPAFNLGGATSFTFKNSGYQPCLVMKIVYGDGEASINEVKHFVIDAAAYNLAGQKVSDGFKGIVIKNGKKMIQK